LILRVRKSHLKLQKVLLMLLLLMHKKKESKAYLRASIPLFILRAILDNSLLF
jgi:hypothetical protein